MFEVIISNAKTGRVHRWMLETQDGARRYANDWIAMKRDQAQRRADARGSICSFSERDYRVEIEYVESGQTILKLGAGHEQTSVAAA